MILNITKKKSILELITMTTEMDLSITQEQEKQKQILDNKSQWLSTKSYWIFLRELETFSVEPRVKSLSISSNQLWIIWITVEFYWNPAYWSPKHC